MILLLRSRASEKHLGLVEERLRKAEGGKEPYVSLQPDEIIHPSPVGVLWKWHPEVGADGPFCPRHRDRLFHKNWLGHTETGNFDESFLNETFWLSCPADQEDFKLPVPYTTRVKNLRAEAAARFGIKYGQQSPVSSSSSTFGRDVLVIHSAEYGLGPQRYLDVTEEVRRLAQNNELHVKVHPNDLGCIDPYPGHYKHLQIVYSYGNKEKRTIKRRDEQMLDLPEKTLNDLLR